MKRRTALIVASATLATGLGIVGTQIVSGQSAAKETVFIPITPCRLLDTRAPADVNTGPRNTPLGANEVVLFNAHDGNDTNSPCAVPTTATAIATNTVAVNPTTRSFLTLYPGDVPNPGTANLTYEGGRAPTPNAANIPLAADGSFNVFNAFGSVNVVMDINGYFQPSTALGGTPRPTGPTGPAGTPGPVGPQGPAGFAVTGHSTSSPDTTGNVGQYTSAAIGTNGNPIISYYDTPTTTSKSLHATTPPAPPPPPPHSTPAATSAVTRRS